MNRAVEIRRRRAVAALTKSTFSMPNGRARRRGRNVVHSVVENDTVSRRSRSNRGSSFNNERMMADYGPIIIRQLFLLDPRYFGNIFRITFHAGINAGFFVIYTNVDNISITSNRFPLKIEIQSICRLFLTNREYEYRRIFQQITRGG